MATREDNEMLAIKRKKLEDLDREGKNPHVIEKYDVTNKTVDIIDNFDEFNDKEVSLAGRIMAIRGHGNMNFMDLQDSRGRIQLLNRNNIIGESYKELKKLDIGDIIGVKGRVTKTNTGQISIETREVTLLTKSLAILPEKWHGLKDQEIRYRKRYLDLIMNPEVKDLFIKRSKILTEIRSYLDSRGFLEVETPILNAIAGGAAARPFITHHNTLDIDMYLRIANELYLKRLIVGGFDKVYEMGRMFRNEGMDRNHNPEYTSIELYQAFTDYIGMMELTEDLIWTVNMKVNGKEEIEFDGKTISLKRPWKRASMTELVKEYADVDFEKISSDEMARDIGRANNLEITDSMAKGDVLAKFFDEFVEEHLIQPIFVYGYPVEISPLAKRNKDKKNLTNRFEVFINGSEMGNAFSELNDAIDQRERFEKQMEMRKKGDEEAHMMDYDFLNAIEVGLPPTGGLGLGIDRIVMLLTNQTSIRDVLLFPTMKPLNDEMEEIKKAKRLVTENISEKIDFSKVKIEPLFEDLIDFENFQKFDYRVVKVINCEEVPKSKKLLKFTLDDGSGKERIILSGIKAFYDPNSLIGKTLLAITNLPSRKMMGINSEGMLLSAIYDYDGEEKLNLLILDDNIPAGAKIY